MLLCFFIQKIILSFFRHLLFSCMQFFLAFLKMKSFKIFVIFCFCLLLTDFVFGIDETTGKLVKGSITKKLTEHDQHIIELWQDVTDRHKLELKLFANSYNVTIDFFKNSNFEINYFCYDLKVVVFIESENFHYKCVSEIYVDEIPLQCETYDGEAECEFLRPPISNAPKKDSFGSTTPSPPVTTKGSHSRQERVLRPTVSTPSADKDSLACSEVKNDVTCDSITWPYYVSIALILILLIITIASIYYQNKLYQHLKVDLKALEDSVLKLSNKTNDFKTETSQSFYELNTKLNAAPRINEDGYISSSVPTLQT